jgi:hypothetical protein
MFWMTTEPEPTQRTRFWFDVLQLNTLLVGAGILALPAVLADAPLTRWLAGVFTVLSVGAVLWKAWRFKQRYPWPN